MRILDWSSVYLAPNVDVALENFNSLFLSVINRVAPVRKMRFKKDSQPWMTGEILNGIRKRDLLFHKVKCNRGDSEIYSRYCAQRNLVQRNIKMAKASFLSVRLLIVAMTLRNFGAILVPLDIRIQRATVPLLLNQMDKGFLIRV